MKKTILSALVPLLMATSAAFGGALISFNDNSGTATAGTYNSTDTFNFDVFLTINSPTTNSQGLSYWLEVPTALAPYINITNESYFTFLVGTDPTDPLDSTTFKVFTDSAGADSGFLTDKQSDGSATGDLGGTKQGTAVVPNTYKVSNLTFTLTGAPAGIYTLQTTTVSPKTSESTQNNGDTTFTDIPIATSQYIITVIPEPATLSLLGLGSLGSFGLTMLRARRRK